MAAVPFIARLMEVLDRERVMVASAVGVRAVTTRERLKMAYNADGENLHEAIHNQSGYRGISGPATLSHRYGVSVRGMESIIRLACIIHRTDY